MSEMLPVVLISLVLAVGSHHFSIKNNNEQLYIRKEWILYLVMSVILILFVGLRTAYNDTYFYVIMYDRYDISAGVFASVSDWALGSNPGFWVVIGLLKVLGASSQTFLLFFAVLTVGIYLWFIRKYTTNIWLSIFLFFTVGTFTFTLAAIKQCFAVALCLVAIDNFLRRRWPLFIIFVILAAAFHPYALMFFIVPFLTYKPWTTRGYILFAIFLFAGFALQPLLGTIVNITTMLGEEFDAASFSGEGINPLRVLVTAVPLILSFICKRYLQENTDKANNLFINLSILNAEIMFVGLFGTANYFGRLANYFQIFQMLSIPFLLRSFSEKSRKIILIGAIVGYSMYFYYANVINQNFDIGHNGITLIQYLRSIF